MNAPETNADRATVEGFGAEWKRFDYAGRSEKELADAFDEYFSLVDWSTIPSNARAFDVGCGTGRWARFVSERVGELHCIDASEEALAVAREKLRDRPNVRTHHASVDAMPIADGSMDFGYSLGVLHHVPDTEGALRACAAKLKPGAPFLVYLYYSLDNRSAVFRTLWRASDVMRRVVSRSPFRVRAAVAELIAGAVYWPLARTARALEKASVDVDAFPLSYYRDRSFYVMRNDALDRFGTRLEQRFSRVQVRDMLEAAGFENVRFREGAPYWCALATKRG
ncbi:MAG: class I SAM-dependent methyltransferase [Polyangiales bacterium]